MTIRYFTAEAQRAQRRMKDQAFGKILSKIRKEKAKSKAGKPYALCPLSSFPSFLCGSAVDLCFMQFRFISGTHSPFLLSAPIYVEFTLAEAQGSQRKSADYSP